MSDITIYVEHADGSQEAHHLPTDMGLSLMEALKGSDYPILATCGGMALCATCHIELLEGTANEASDDELNMLDTLFNTTENSRLSCQIRLNELSNGAVLRILGESN
jgi:ferredoxin